jgi:sugar phosphate isomerase/epimerase
MKLGFVSAILPDLALEEVIDFAARERFECVELMCWPKGKAERRYAGVTHVDVAALETRKAALRQSATYLRQFMPTQAGR